MTDQAEGSRHTATRLVWGLSLAGFLPFAGLAIALSTMNVQSGLFLIFFDIFKTWSALILAFLGGVRWGLAIAKKPVSSLDIAFSILPPVIGWLAIFLLPDSYTVLVLLLAYCALGAWDSFSVNAGVAPAWYGKIRTVLTFAVAAAHIAVFFALFQA